MDKRLDYAAVAPAGNRAMLALYPYLQTCGLESGLLHLVWLRVSQINGCAYCVDMHWRDALKDGDSERRLNSVVTWHEAPFFSARERAAFAWAETLTRIVETRASDDDYAAVKAVFTDKELADLSFAIAMMNALNRLAIGFRKTPPLEVPS